MPHHPPDEPLWIQTEDGLSLEAMIARPERPSGALLACHPHPLHGGTMTNKVVHSLYKAFRDAGFVTLRFNFRGAGRSEGSHGMGIAEASDVAAAFEVLQEQLKALQPAEHDDLPHVIGGFSFGSVVGLAQADHEPACTHRVGVGLPLAPELAGERAYDLQFLTARDPRPLYLVTGADDAFCPLPHFERLVKRLRDGGAPVEASVVEGANHFFDRQGHIVRQEFERIACSILGRDKPFEETYPVLHL